MRQLFLSLSFSVFLSLCVFTSVVKALYHLILANLCLLQAKHFHKQVLSLSLSLPQPFNFNFIVYTISWPFCLILYTILFVLAFHKIIYPFFEIKKIAFIIRFSFYDQAVLCVMRQLSIYLFIYCFFLLLLNL